MKEAYMFLDQQTLQVYSDEDQTHEIFKINFERDLVHMEKILGVGFKITLNRSQEFQLEAYN